MATHSSILVWRIPWTQESGGLQSMGLKESDTAEQLTLSLSLFHPLYVTAINTSLGKYLGTSIFLA